MKTKIAYKEEHKVYLEGTHIGTIKKLVEKQYQFHSKGISKNVGDIYPTLEACKYSLDEGI